MENKRNNSIDLLRIILTFFVCICHVLGHGGALNAGSYSVIYYYLFWLIETIAICAVDGYGLISGYVSQSKKINLKRIILIWFETLFYSLIVTVLLNFVFYKSIPNIISLCFPVINRCFWYITAYIPLAFLMPYINMYIENIDKQKAKRLFIIIFIIFSIISIIHDNYSDYGYSFLWLFILYVLGGLTKKTELFKNIKTAYLVLLFVLCISTSFGFLYVTNKSYLIDYISPTVLLSAIILLIIFSRINIESKIIGFISKLCLGIYLFQCSPVVWKLIENRFDLVINYNYFIGVVLVIVFSLLIFVVGSIIDCARLFLFKVLKIDKLADIIGKLLDKVFSYTIVLLEKLNIFSK